MTPAHLLGGHSLFSQAQHAATRFQLVAVQDQGNYSVKEAATDIVCFKGQHMSSALSCIVNGDCSEEHI